MVFLLGFLLSIVALFLILLVLIQRGKGGGLAGALGGMGGQSAFGTKAGDLFTKITIVVAAVWIVLCILSVRVLSYASRGPLDLPGDSGTPAADAPLSNDEKGSVPTDGPASSESSQGNTPAPSPGNSPSK
ncbi:MAG: preprotein translocase subunit SecG [Thermoguttaceae bacterium]